VVATICEICDGALVYLDEVSRRDINVTATTNALSALVAAGRMRVLCGDVPIDDMLDLARSEMKYTIVTFLGCEECHRTRFWGLCIRGTPKYEVSEPGAELLWPWERIPRRKTWARTT
jgi:hypothetical protein